MCFKEETERKDMAHKSNGRRAFHYALCKIRGRCVNQTEVNCLKNGVNTCLRLCHAIKTFPRDTSLEVERCLR